MMLQVKQRRRGYTLLAVLLIVMILSLTAYRFSDYMSSEQALATRTTQQSKARANAASGVHYAMGMLADPATMAALLGGNPFDNPAEFQNVAVGASDDTSGQSEFTLINVVPDSVGGGTYQLRYGVSDESAKLNINTLIQLDKAGDVLYAALMKLPEMTPEVADAIVDWVDEDDIPRPTGAETETYLSLPNPYSCKNAPLNSIEELLQVQGVTPLLLFGSDRNRNGLLDPDEEMNAPLTRGWVDYLTCYGRQVNVDPDGLPRIYLRERNVGPVMEGMAAVASEELTYYVAAAMLYGTKKTTDKVSGTTEVGNLDQLKEAVDATMAKSDKAKNRPKTLMSLVDTRVELPKASGASKDAPTIIIESPLNESTQQSTSLPELMAFTTTTKDYEMPPRVNVNTAPREVLLGIPGFTDVDVEAILAARSSLNPLDLSTTTGAWIITQARVPIANYQSAEKYITGETMTYRINSIGHFTNNGVAARVEAVIDTNLGHPRIVYFRDLTDLGRGFQVGGQ